MSKAVDAKQGRRTITIEEAGMQLGISRNAAYAAASRGEIPIITMGRRKLVPTALFDALLEPKREGA